MPTAIKAWAKKRTIFIELTDVNYPGSTYSLKYDRENDLLEGLYYQAALQRSFTVRFIRMD